TYFEAMPEFVASPRPAWAALLAYVGGGTTYPWDELARSVDRHRRAARVVRVVISDQDFCSNYHRPPDEAERDRGLQGAVACGRFVALITNGNARTRDALIARGAQWIDVAAADEFPAVARALADALYPPGGGSGSAV
ncbi:MAG: hypothetical protein KC583_11510, partial [Myxococcales bacterium]|nr:hypothetical protein [Myxococcales bacterium]